jgi:phosphoglycolate phosphatase-like HAD superfamily hydrolase
MTSAFEELFSIANAFHDIPMAGRTDAWILSDAAAAHGIPADSADLARFPDVYVRHLAAEIAASEQRGTTLSRGGRYGVMPGVRALLEALIDHPDAYLALLTGNYETGAQMKLEHFDLWRYFRSGAFGDGAADRNGLVPKALARVAACGGPAFASSDTVVIGDTPLDVACAKAGGARLIAVATGYYSVDQLRAAGADVVFEDLSETGAVVRSIFRK